MSHIRVIQQEQKPQVVVTLRKKGERRYQEGGGKRDRDRGKEARERKGKEVSWLLPRSVPILGVSRSRDRSFLLVWPIHSLFPYLALRHWFTFAPAPCGSTEKVPSTAFASFPFDIADRAAFKGVPNWEHVFSFLFFFFLFRISFSFLENRRRSFFSRSYRTFRLEFIKRGKTSLFSRRGIWRV